MTREAWGKFANPSGAASPDVPPAEVAEPSPEGTTLDLAAAVMRGEYGVDDERREKLGDRYQEVQDLINYIDGASASQLADDVERGMFGVVPTRSDVLGDRFKEVQAIVNQRAGVGASRVYTVKSGDTLSEIGASLGIDWHTIASKNGIGAPYTIYPGQKLSY